MLSYELLSAVSVITRIYVQVEEEDIYNALSTHILAITGPNYS